MADDFELEADISIDVSSAVRDAKRLADALADLNDASGNADNNIEKLERASASAASTLSRFVADSRNATRSSRDQAKAISNLVNQYRQLAQTSGKAVAQSVVSGQNPAQIALKQVQKQMDDEKAFSALLSSEYKKRESEAADTATKIAQERESIEKASRARELSALREAMQRRDQLETQAATATAKEREKIAESSRQREMTALRQAIQERYRLQAQAEKAYTGAQVENAVRSMSGMNFGQAFNSNAFDGLRQSSEYADMMNESLRGLANQRYALYDVSTTLGTVAAAATAAGTAAVVMGGQFDKAFGQVERTTGLTGAAAEDLRAQLVGITTELGGVNFEDVAGIATLGAQMNIADDALGGFTDTVAKFAATTDVTVDAAATGFGRLAQLTKTPQNEISNLASAIYETGINAVATESQILSVAEQIAVAGNLAGFTNTEIVALSSALASLGVAPEQSRGAFERIFGNFIPSAIAKGGEALQGFADMAGMSAEEFASTWESKPQEAFNAFLTGLSKVENQTLALRELGIVNVRDINVLNRLSANMDVYNAALQDTNQAYADNTALNEGVAIAQDNLIDRLSKLANSFKAMVAAAGQSDILNGIVDMLLRISEAMRSLVESPVGKTIAGIVLALTGLAAVLTAVAAAFYFGKASLLAFVVALRSNVASSNGLTLSVRALMAELVKLSAVQKVTAAGMGEMSAKSAVAATAVNGLKLALKGVLATTAIGAGFVVLTKAVEGVQRAFASASEVADQYFQANNIDVSGFATAIKEDTQALAEGGNAYRTASVAVKDTEASLGGLASEIQSTTGVQIALNGSTDTTATSYRNLTTAIGDSTKALLAQKLAEDPAMQQLYEHRELADQLGLSFETMIQKMLTDPSGHGGSQYLDTFIEKAFSAEEQQGNLNAEYLAGQESLRQLQDGVRNYETEIQTQLTSAQIYSQAMSAMGVEIENTANATDELGAAADENADSLSGLVDGLFESVSGVADVQGALYDLGESLYENGNSFSAFSEAGRANLDTLQQTVSAMATAAGEDTNVLAQNIMGMMIQLQNMGVDTSNELGFLGNMLNQLVGTKYGLDFNSTAARQDINAFIQSAIAALQVRAQLERTSATIAASAARASNPFGGVVAAGITAAGELAAQGYEQQAKELQGLKANLTDFGKAGGQAGRAVSDGFKGAAREASNAGGAANKAGKAAKGAGDKAADSAKKAQKEVRTLKDYANDLASVFDRQLEFAFGNQNAKDDTANIIQDMKDKIKDAKAAIADMRSNIGDLSDKLRDAKQKVRDFNAELKSLRADKNTLEYQLKVAVEYGDTLRAAEIRGELAEKNEEIKSTENDRADASKEVNKIIKDQSAAQKELAQALKDYNTGLRGNSQQARDNRAAVQDLVNSYKAQLVQLAANGASQTTLKNKAKELKDEFVRQTSKMGLSREETKKYTTQMSDFKKVIDKVPRNVTVTTKASTSSATKSINEFIQKQRQKSVTLKTKVTTPKGVSGGTYRPGKVSTAGRTATGGTYKPSSINSRGALSAPSVRTTTIYAGDTRTTQVKGSGNRTGGLPWSTGGLIPEYRATGGVMGLHPGKPKGTDTAPAWLTPGEWVIQKKAVDHYGSDFFASLNAMRFPQYLAQGSGGGQVLQSSGPAVQLVELMPNQVQQIVRAVSTTIKVDGQTLATSVNGSNRNNSTRGGN